MHTVWDVDKSRQVEEQRCLRGDASYVGNILLLVEGVSLFAGVLLGWLSRLLSLDGVSYLVTYAAFYTFSMVVPAVLVSLVSGRRHFPLSPAHRTNFGDVFLGVLAAIGVCMLANIAASIFVTIFESVGAQTPDFPDYLEPTVSSLAWNIFVFAVLPALCEELVFRGYILRTLRRYGDWFAVMVSALVFGLMHGNLAQIPFAIITGIALGWLYIMTENIWLAVSVHFINNALSYFLQYLGLGMDETNQGLYTTVVIFALSVIGLIAFAVLLARGSALLRRLPRKSRLSVGNRIGSLLTSLQFILAIALYVSLTVWGSIG